MAAVAATSGRAGPCGSCPAALHYYDLAGAVDVADLQIHQFVDAQTAGIGGLYYHALTARSGRLDEAGDLLGAQDVRRRLRLFALRKNVDHIGPVRGVGPMNDEY